MKQLDESETRYKDENWTLEGQVQELIAAQKDAAEREKRSTQAFNVLQSEKNKTQKELDEVRGSHAKLSEEHAAAIKHHDIEIGTAKRSIATADNERSALQRKIEDLTSQNQELARAFSSSQRAKMMERDGILNRSDEEFDHAGDDVTPEHSPPQSPMKGTTPRHSMLETETLKTSLQHAQRTIQSHRSQVHREKTEKLELRRMLQEARDEVERLRNDAEAPVPRRSKKTEAKEQKKYSKLLLGNSRPTREDIYSEEDEEWEDHHEPPRLFGSESSGSPRAAHDGPPTDHFETANEATDGAFETANERGTETDDFQTGAEEFSGTESEVTETDTPTKAPRRTRSNLTATNFRTHTARKSFDSTASTSNDEDTYEDAGVPGSAPPRMKLRVSRGGHHRRGRHVSDEQAAKEGSPASLVNSTDGTPRTGGQSLFAELGELDGSGDESFNEGTPSRTLFGSNASNSSTLRTIPSIQKFGMMSSPAVADPSKAGSEGRPATAVARVEMVDSGTMTDDLEQPAPMALATGARSINAAETADDDASKRISTYSDSGAQHDPEISESLSKFPLPPLAEKPSLPELEFTSIETQHVTPVEVPEPLPPALTLSSIQREELEPKAEPVVAPPVPELSVSGIKSEVCEPRAEPEPVPAPLSMSTISTEVVDPRAEPESVPAPLSMSTISTEVVDPRAEPEPEPASLSLSSIRAEALDPRAEPESPRPDLTVSQVHTQVLEPDDTPLDTLAAVLGLSSAGGSRKGEAAALVAGLGAGALGAHAVERGMESDVAQPASAQSMAAIQSETVEPQVEREAVPELSMTTINAQDLEPVAEPEVVPELGMAAISSQSWEPVVEPEVVPDLGMAAINSQSCEPVVEPEVIPELSMAGISSQSHEPVAEEVVLPELRMMDIHSQELEPIAEPEPPAPEPIALGISNVSSEHIHPVEETRPEPPSLTTSTIRAESVAPTKAPSPVDPRPDFGFTTIQSLETRPVSPRSPKRDAFILPRDAESSLAEPHKSRPGFVRGGVLGWDNNRSATPPLIAEDETRQSPGQSPKPETPESQRPLQAMSTNSDVRTRKPRNVTLDSSAQTALTSDVLDQLMRPRLNLGHESTRSIESGLGGSGPRMRRGSTESSGSVVRHRSRGADSATDFYRPTSASSSKAATEELPPLPVNHRQAIEAARTRSSDGQGSMGPPLWPASAVRSSRPSTPSVLKPIPSVGSPTPRAARASAATLLDDAPSVPHLRSRQSSVTSFASELDSRFNMPGASAAMVPGGFGPNTDPRMIQAITQTMIGEFLWKYTRKTGRDEMSENRHRRYFWVHPYTRTLYWSERDPTTTGQRSEARTKSIPIEAVRVVTDDNPMPPGLPRKSLIVVSPGRTVKFTCTTNQRHETWLNALSYLLLRTNQDGQSDAELMAENITREDIDEFNPQVGRRPGAPSARHRQQPSMSSFNSRSVRNESPAMDMSMNIPTLSPPKRRAPAQQQPRGKGTMSRLSGYWKPSHAFSTLRTRRAAVTPEVYVNGQVHDSAEDVRKEMERQDEDADRLENVRACCDGKFPSA